MAQKLMMGRQHTLCMSLAYPDDPVKISQQPKLTVQLKITMQTFLAIFALGMIW